MTNNYILVDRVPLLELNTQKWARWFETADRTVKFSSVKGAEISTVFLGIDHNFDTGAPLLFETMVFGGVHDGYQTRTTTWEEAEQAHELAVVSVVRDTYNAAIEEKLSEQHAARVYDELDAAGVKRSRFPAAIGILQDELTESQFSDTADEIRAAIELLSQA